MSKINRPFKINKPQLLFFKEKEKINHIFYRKEFKSGYGKTIYKNQTKVKILKVRVRHVH